MRKPVLTIYCAFKVSRSTHSCLFHTGTCLTISETSACGLFLGNNERRIDGPPIHYRYFKGMYSYLDFICINRYMIRRQHHKCIDSCMEDVPNKPQWVGGIQSRVHIHTSHTHLNLTFPLSI